MNRRVVVTGMGMVTPLGAGVDHNWKRIINGESGITRITHFDPSELSSQIAGMVPRGTQAGVERNRSAVVPIGRGVFHAALASRATRINSPDRSTREALHAWLGAD